MNDNSTRLLSYCCAHRSVITGSWFQQKNIYRFTWLCNDQRTKKEIDHILTNDRLMFKSVRVYRGAEPPANSDHRMLAAYIFLNPYRAWRRPARTRLDFTLLAQDSELADKYNVTISNAFAALGHHSQDPESARKQVRDTIVTTAIAVVPVRRSKHRPWLKTETLDIIDQKRDARLTGKRDEHRQLKGIYRAKAKADLDEFYNALADEAETGFRQNNLQPAFSSIKWLIGKQDNYNVLTTPVTRLDNCGGGR